MHPTSIESLRTQIDALDAEIIRLIEARLGISRAIQAERLACGGPRVLHAREGEIVARWRKALGVPGGRIARTLLELSRGSVAEP
jgi:chorismate mutase